MHLGSLCIDGAASTGFAVRHADGTPYGARVVSLPAVDTARKVIGILEHMGFKPTQARAGVDKALQVVGATDPAVLLQAALRAT